MEWENNIYEPYRKQEVKWKKLETQEFFPLAEVL
jgi:hypothetical protein